MIATLNDLETIGREREWMDEMLEPIHCRLLLLAQTVEHLDVDPENPDRNLYLIRRGLAEEVISIQRALEEAADTLARRDRVAALERLKGV